MYVAYASRARFPDFAGNKVTSFLGFLRLVRDDGVSHLYVSLLSELYLVHGCSALPVPILFGRGRDAPTRGHR